jgi:hypothetical protein
VHKAKAALRIGPLRSTTQSPHVRIIKRVSRRSLIYNSSLASEQLHYRNTPKTQTYPYEPLFTNMTNQSPAEVVLLLVGTPCTHYVATPVMPSLPYDNCPEAIQKLPSGPLCIFVDGSWNDEGNGLENLFLSPHIPRPSQTGGAGIVIMAENPEWPDNICTIHLSNGQTISTNAYQMELAAMMSALHLVKMDFNH